MKPGLSVIQIVSPPRAAADGSVGITGPERRAMNLAGQWAGRGIDVTFLYPRRGSLWRRFVDTGRPVVDFEVIGKWDYRAVMRLVRLVRSHQARLIHTQGGPAVDLAAVIAGRLTGASVIVTRPVMIEDQQDRSAASLSVLEAIDRTVTLPGCSAVVAVSRNGHDRLCRRTGPGRVRLIHNGVKAYPAERLTRRTALGRQRPLHVGMIGHLLPYKGWSDFLRVAALLTAEGLDIRWHIVGEGPERAALETEVRALGLADRLEFHGLLHDVSTALFTFDLFLFTSHREGLSVAVLEAMSAGLPVVATEVAGIRDQVIDGHNGFVLPVRDIAGLASAVRTLALDHELREVMGSRSRARMENCFSEQAMIEGYASLYHEVVDGEGRT